MQEDNVGLRSNQQKPRVHWLHIATFCLTLLIFILLIVILGVAAASLNDIDDCQKNVAVEPTAVPLGLPGIEFLTWADIVQRARGQIVSFWATPVSNYDAWIDSFLAPQVAQLYGVTLVRVPMTDEGSGKATEKISAELQAGNTKNGSVGLIWTNGPDFAYQRSNNLIYGPFATSLPNAANFDFVSPAISTDFGQPTGGYEFPYNAAQIIFIYNPLCSGMSPNPPQSMKELVNWVQNNPGKFTYANPFLDYTGSAFIRHFLYEFGGGYQQFSGGYKSDVYKTAVAKAFAQLNAIQPSIYRLSGSSTPYYPDNQTVVDNLFATGDICLTVSYDPDHVGQMIHSPQEPGMLNFPTTTKAYLPASGTIGNVNFVAIAINSGSLYGALVVANYIGSMAAQYSRRSVTPPGIGTIQAYSPSCDAIVNGGWSVPFKDVPSFSETPSDAALTAAFLPEIDAQYATQMQIDWQFCIQQSLSSASGTDGSGAACA